MSKIGIFVGSVYGNAQHVAEEVGAMLSEHGRESEVFTDPTLNDVSQVSSLLFISSTTGQGDIPPNLEFFIDDLKDESPNMGQRPFAVVGLGDSSYGETYCGAGRQIFELLTQLQGKPITTLLQIDACETLEPEDEVVKWAEKLLPDLQ
ncbi:flavodoxin domain-containing protein [uncultured Paraglaciecola sp.]|uniref:flavodoxin domain-containing protein n=1 Tax=uncultured Paraglaciecola sp. TaxID=1765024 RepID=UPI0026286373|nr:flavodoxin domain-containing protein [uncultured Paraglaciecola sp.]